MTRILPVCLLSTLLLPVGAQSLDSSFFEARIRPVLVQKCQGCHSTAKSGPMGGLAVDTKAGLAKGGATGPVIVAGKPAESRLMQAIRYTDPHLQMPPSGKLPDTVIADFERWIAAGAPDPRQDSAAATPAHPKAMSIEEGRKWWAFLPVHEIPAPKVRNTRWPKGKIDAFILSRLEQKGLTPAPPADPRTLVRRAYIDLTGYKPTYEEVEVFAGDRSPNAWTNLIDRLLASPAYGERWGRHWMDVARYGEDNPTSSATNPPYPYAWRYRDWIIEAINRDVPYDRFVKLQLAADLIPDTSRDDLRALGYLGAAPVYHKDLRLSAEVISGFLFDDWDERVDAVSRGILGLTVSCARCHDHKFDPILTTDYYGLVGVFASTMRAERPLFEVEPEVEARFLWLQNRLFDLHYSANLLTAEASTVEGAADRVAKWKAEIETLKAEIEAMGQKYPQIVASQEKNWTFGRRRQPTPSGPTPPPLPFTNAVFEAAQFVDGSDPHFTVIRYRPGEARDVPVLPHGNPATPGATAARRFPLVLSHDDGRFHSGSGRLELSERIFSDAAPLAARVIVNRVWGWHFGQPLSTTPSDFGTQGERPSHPELLDDLAARFISHGWSLKWLNREIMLSAAYRQSGRPRPEAAKADPENTLVWRMTPRRMDVESYRDSLLRGAGRLDERLYGPSLDVESAANTRRTIYGRVSRGSLSNLLRAYDLPDPMQTAAARGLTTTPVQQLFLLNSAFMKEAAAFLARMVREEPDNAAKVNALYRRVLARNPVPEESEEAVRFLAEGTIEQYAQILLASNEEIFWP